MKKSVDEIFEREDERMQGMQEMLQDYLETVTNDELPPEYNVQKWAAAELIMFLAFYAGETHYEMIGIMDECKDQLRKRLERMREDITEGEDNND